MVLDEALGIGATISVIVISSVILILLGVIYFAVSLFIIKVAAGLVGYPDVSSGLAVLSAASLMASNRK